jgi:D-alanyl-lipoteichoic acid acyltransferase DltB (MBOAT superfamily)
MAFIPKYILILFGLIVIDYLAGLQIEKSAGKRRKVIFISAVIINVCILSFFKYYLFFVSDLNKLVEVLGASYFTFPAVLLLPLGISFHIFQTLGYLIEIKRGNIKAEKHLGIFSLYVLFYPQLVAGPIERPQNMIPQFYEQKTFNPDRVLVGLKIMMWGFFKKIVVADRLSLYVSEVYKSPEQTGTLNLWLAVLIFFPIQVYCDFSGYSSIALGSAKVMGFDLTENFKKPFSSLTTAELWTRWHISLSSWLRDYLYQPLVIFFRNYGRWAIVIGLMVTFFISGFWHGAGWSFIVYGLVQGTIITTEFLLGIKSTKLAKSTGGKIKGMVATYFLFAFSLIFFRAGNVKNAFVIIKKMFWEINFQFVEINKFHLFSYAVSFLSIIFLFFFEKNLYENYLYKRNSLKTEVIFASSMVVFMIAFGFFHNISFIYFQF